MSKLVTAIEPLIISSRPKSELCVLFYPPYYSTELERPETGASELIFVPSMIRRPAWFDGVLRALQALNVEFEIRDLTRTNPQELSRYKQVWTFSTDEMNETDQRTLLRFVRDGGNLVIFPAIPYREMSQKPCSLLRDAFNAHPETIETIDSPLIDLLGLNDIKCANPQLVYGATTLENATIIAKTLTGKPCGFLKPYGDGMLIHLGTWLGFDTEAHKAAYEALLRLSDATLNTTGCDNGFIRVRQRFTSRGEGILFVGNYFNEDHQGSVSYTHPINGEKINLPFSNPRTVWPAMHGLITPLCLSVLPEIRLLHSTSDVLGVKVVDGQLQLILNGHRDMYGEIVFEGNNVWRIAEATSNGSKLKRIEYDNRIVFTYQHIHNQQFEIMVAFAKITTE